MAKIGRTCKEYMVKELTAKLKDSPNLFVTECTGLSVEELSRLRGSLKTVKASYFVIKNSMGRLALDSVDKGELAQFLEGTIGIASTISDPISASKTLLKFSKDSGKLKVKAGFVEGKLVNESEVKELSLLPAKEVILAQVFGGMKAPITNFVNVLNETIRKFVFAINAIKEKKGRNS